MPDVQPRRRLRSRDKEEILWEAHPSALGMLSFYGKWMGGAVLVSLLLILVAKSGVLGVGPVAVVILLLCGGVELIARLIRMRTAYQITRGRLYEHTGILRKRVEQNPINRIEQVTVDQSFIQRMLKVGKVDFDTAAEHVRNERSAPFMDWWGIRHPEMVAAIVDDLINEADMPQRLRKRRGTGAVVVNEDADAGPFDAAPAQGFQWRDADEVDEDELGDGAGLPARLRDDIVRYDD